MIHIDLEDNLYLELVNPFASKMIFSTIDTNRAYLRRYLAWVDDTKSEIDSLEYIKRSLKGFAEKQSASYFIWLNNEIIGTCSLWISNPDTMTCEIGYWIAESYTKKGIGSKCAKKLVNIGFTFFNANKIEITCAVDNISSNKIAEKLGFRHEGIIRNMEKVNDVIYDHNVYGLIKSEYQEFV